MMRLRILSTRDDDEIVCLFVLSLSLSLSLSKVVTEQSAQNVMIFSPKKKKSKTTNERIFSTTQKNVITCAVFFHLLLFPSQPWYLLAATLRTIRMKQKNETRVRTMRKSIYFVRVRVCVQKQCCATLFTNKEEFFFAGFLVSRECRSLVKFDIIRISPRGERARFALNSKRNLRNVLDPVKRFFPRRWRLW